MQQLLTSEQTLRFGGINTTSMNDKDFEKALLAAQSTLAVFTKRLTRHKERAEDLLQDGNLKLWKNRSQYTEGNFLGWCKTVIRHTYLNQVAVESRMKFSERDFVSGHAADTPGSEDDTPYQDRMYHKYLSQEPNQEDYWLENRILEAIAEFEPHQALLINLKLQGVEYKDIAKTLGITANNAKQRYFNIVKELRKNLDDKGLLDN